LSLSSWQKANLVQQRCIALLGEDIEDLSPVAKAGVVGALALVLVLLVYFLFRTTHGPTPKPKP
jgi:hypothetical protein